MGEIRHFLQRKTVGDPVGKTGDAEAWNRVCNILEGMAGIGLRVDKPTDREGFGWRFILDGSSDGGAEGIPANYRPPWQTMEAYPWPFGVNISGADVTILRPAANVGGTQGRITCSDTTITMTDGDEYIWAEIDMTSAPYTLSVTGPHDAEATNDVPNGLYRFTLYRFTLETDDEDNVTSAVMAEDYIHGVAWPQVHT
jgi:hypothetical protein